MQLLRLLKPRQSHFFIASYLYAHSLIVFASIFVPYVACGKEEHQPTSAVGRAQLAAYRWSDSTQPCKFCKWFRYPSRIRRACHWHGIGSSKLRCGGRMRAVESLLLIAEIGQSASTCCTTSDDSDTSWESVQENVPDIGNDMGDIQT